MTEEIPIKLVVVGDGCVGKTCMLVSYTQDRFSTDYVPTVFDTYIATVKIDGRIVNLSIWDTAGQEQFRRLRPLSYSRCDVFLIVSSVIDPSSFKNAQKNWYHELKEHVTNPSVIFVGNKIDMRDELLQMKVDPKNTPIIKQVAIKEIGEKFNCKYMECSALTQDGLKPIFDEAMRMVIQKKSKPIVKKIEDDFFCQLI